jgi:hypothetical protein
MMTKLAVNFSIKVAKEYASASCASSFPLLALMLPALRSDVDRQVEASVLL